MCGNVGDDHVLGIDCIEALSGVVHCAVNQLDEFLRCLVWELPWAHLPFPVAGHRVAASALSRPALVGYCPLLIYDVLKVIYCSLDVHAPYRLGDVIAVLVVAVEVHSSSRDKIGAFEQLSVPAL